MPGMVEEAIIERTTVRLPEELLRQAKQKAVAERRTLTSLIEEGLRGVIADRGPREARRRVSLPVSRATGGLMPGVDLADLKPVQDREDAEYVRKFWDPR